MYHFRPSRTRLLAGFGGACAAGVLAARGTAKAENYVLRLGHPEVATSPMGMAATQFASGVARRSNGQVSVEVYPLGQLANQADSITGMTSGTLDLAIQVTSFLVPQFPHYQVLDMPFLFKDLATAYRVVDGPIGNELFAELETKGITGLAWGSVTFKQLETNKPVVTPADMKGVRMRVQPGAVYVALYQALGATPIPIDISEVYTALSQHTIDGVDLAIEVFASDKLDAVVKNVAIANLALPFTPLMASKRKLDSLPPPLQAAIKEEAKAMLPGWRTNASRRAVEAVEALKRSGIAFTEIQRDGFRKAVLPVYAAFQPKIGGDLLDRIQRAAT